MALSNINSSNIMIYLMYWLIIIIIIAVLLFVIATIINNYTLIDFSIATFGIFLGQFMFEKRKIDSK